MTGRLDYEALVAGLPDAVVGVDDGQRIVLWNPAAEALLGRSARRVTGRTLKEVFPPDTSLVRHLTDTLATGESRSESAATVETGDGRVVHVSVVTAPLAGRSGALDAAVAVVRDISRLHQLEAEVRRGETLAAVGRVAVGLAHEIRNPLGAIRGAVQLLKRELGDEARWGEYTDVLLQEVTRVNRIAQPPPAARARGALVPGARGGERRPDPAPLRSEPAADPGRRGPPPAGLP